MKVPDIVTTVAFCVGHRLPGYVVRTYRAHWNSVIRVQKGDQYREFVISDLDREFHRDDDVFWSQWALNIITLVQLTEQPIPLIKSERAIACG